MRLKERAPLQNFAEQKDRSLLISAPPIFDLRRARDLSRQVHEWAKRDNFRSLNSLKIALTLALYNDSLSSEGYNKDKSILLKRLTNLVKEEIVSSDLTNPLPTIGIEIETPRKVVRKEKFYEYAEFFDEIGMPRNKINRITFGEDCWEFSPSPSYCASTQSRIIAELIKGRFIPSLLFSKDGNDVRELLDDRLVSLHINLGIPENTKMQYLLDKGAGFPAILSLAFSSPERLRNRNSRAFWDLKPSEETEKGKGGDLGRLEIKAVELRTENQYRLIKEAQLLGAAFFAFLIDKQTPLGKIWSDLITEVTPVFKQFGVSYWESLPVDKETAYLIMRDTDLNKRLRHVVDRKAIEISQLLSPNSLHLTLNTMPLRFDSF